MRSPSKIATSTPKASDIELAAKLFAERKPNTGGLLRYSRLSSTLTGGASNTFSQQNTLDGATDWYISATDDEKKSKVYIPTKQARPNRQF